MILTTLQGTDLAPLFELQKWGFLPHLAGLEPKDQRHPGPAVWSLCQGAGLTLQASLEAGPGGWRAAGPGSWAAGPGGAAWGWHGRRARTLPCLSLSQGRSSRRLLRPLQTVLVATAGGGVPDRAQDSTRLQQRTLQPLMLTVRKLGSPVLRYVQACGQMVEMRHGQATLDVKPVLSADGRN